MYCSAAMRARQWCFSLAEIISIIISIIAVATRAAAVMRSSRSVSWIVRRSAISNNRSKNFVKRPHRQGRIFHVEKLTWHRPVERTIQSAAAFPLMPLLIILLRTSQRWLTMLFNISRTTAKIVPFPWGIYAPCNTWITLFLWPTWVSPQTASQSVQSFLQGSRTWLTNTQTNHAIPYEVKKEQRNLTINGKNYRNARRRGYCYYSNGERWRRKGRI